jgi:hypothetical protein
MELPFSLAGFAKAPSFGIRQPTALPRYAVAITIQYLPCAHLNFVVFKEA